MNIDLKDKVILTFIDNTTPRVDGSTRPLNLTLGNTYELVEYKNGVVTVCNDNGNLARYIPSRFSFAVYIDNNTLEYRNSINTLCNTSVAPYIGSFPLH